MLYDILSPLIFFASLGGILLIVGRVVIRIRREQLSTNIQSVAAHTPSAHTSLWQPASKEVTQLLQPTQKSVHAMRSRFAQVSQMVRQTKDTLGTWRTRRREAKAAARAALPTAPPPAAAIPPDVLQSQAPTITAPPRRGLRGRFASLKLRRRRTQLPPAAPREEILLSVAADSTPPLAPAATPVSPPEVATPPLAAVEPQPASPVTPPPKAEVPTPAPVSEKTSVVASAATSQSLASSLLRRVQGKGRHQPEVLRTAEAELENHDFQAAEDRLVPYIVKHPKDTTAYMLLGQAAMGREAWEEAMEIFEQVVTWNRKQAGAYANLGLAAYRAGRFTKALQALQRSLDSDPYNQEVLAALLSIAEKMDNPALQHSIREKIELADAHAKQQKNVPQNASV